MNSLDQHPLVTFVVVAYEQESYVREALEGAFSQDYPRLQIILSDDCSKDRTFAIMEEMAAAYDGPHEVLLNRNSKNLGLIAHINYVVSLARGELIVCAAGDDVSYAERSKTLVDAWQSSAGQAHLLHSSAHRISADGRLLGLREPHEGVRFSPSPAVMAKENVGVIGATSAFTPALFSRFGPLDPELGCEDLLMPFWAALVGGLLYVDRPLVAHREVGVSSAEFHPVSGKEVLFGSWIRWHRWWRNAFRGRLAAVELHFDQPPPELVRLCGEGMARFGWPIRLAETPYRGRWQLVASMLRDERLPRRRALKLAFMYLFPLAYEAQFNLKHRAGRPAAGAASDAQ